MSKDRVSSALIASEPVKKSEKNFDDNESTRNDAYQTTIRKIRNENRDEDKILRDLRFLLDPEKDHYENLEKLLLLLVITIFNMKV